MKWTRAALVALLLGCFLSTAAAAHACSRPAPPTLAQILDPTGGGRDHPPPGTVVGVYEQEHIAGAPPLGLRDERTVSVVVRYWGVAPDLGRVMHGDGLGILGGDSCGNESGSNGDVGHHWVTEPGAARGLPFLESSGGRNATLTSAEEAALAARFGPPVVLEVAFVTRLAALIQLWWLPAGMAAGVGGGVALALALRRRRARPEPGADL